MSPFCQHRINTVIAIDQILTAIEKLAFVIFRDPVKNNRIRIILLYKTNLSFSSLHICKFFLHGKNKCEGKVSKFTVKSFVENSVL